MTAAVRSVDRLSTAMISSRSRGYSCASSAARQSPIVRSALKAGTMTLTIGMPFMTTPPTPGGLTPPPTPGGSLRLLRGSSCGLLERDGPTFCTRDHAEHPAPAAQLAGDCGAFHRLHDGEQLADLAPCEREPGERRRGKVLRDEVEVVHDRHLVERRQRGALDRRHPVLEPRVRRLHERKAAADAVGEVLVLAETVARGPLVEAEPLGARAAIAHVAPDQRRDRPDGRGRRIVGDEARALHAAGRAERVHQEHATEEVREPAPAPRRRDHHRPLRAGEHRVELEELQDARQVVGRQHDVVVEERDDIPARRRHTDVALARKARSGAKVADDDRPAREPVHDRARRVAVARVDHDELVRRPPLHRERGQARGDVVRPVARADDDGAPEGHDPTSHTRRLHAARRSPTASRSTARVSSAFPSQRQAAARRRIAARSHVVTSAYSSAAAKAPTSSTGTTMPASGPTTSVIPARAVATHGVPHAIASRTTFGNPSSRLANAKTSAAENQSDISPCGRAPAKTTRSAQPSARARATSAVRRSSRSTLPPTSTSRTSRRRTATRANASRSTSTPFRGMSKPA